MRVSVKISWFGLIFGVGVLCEISCFGLIFGGWDFLLFLYYFWSLLWNAHFKTGFVIDVYMAIALLNIYWKCNAFDCAIQLFDELPKRNMAIINSGIYHLLCNIPPSLIKIGETPQSSTNAFFFPNSYGL